MRQKSKIYSKFLAKTKNQLTKHWNITYFVSFTQFNQLYLGQVSEIAVPNPEDLDVVEPPTEENGSTIAWVGIMGSLLIIAIIGVYFKQKLVG